MVSDVSICNIALTKLGQNAITSFTDNTENARKCNIFFTQTKQEVLRDFTWNFANKKIVLTELAIVNDIWKYVYLYPNDCLFLKYIYNDDTKLVYNFVEYEILNINGQVCIATDIKQAKADYVCDIKDPTLYDNSFIEALSNKLASVLAISITGNETLANIFYDLYKTTLANAKKFSAQEKNKIFKRISNYVDCRSGYIYDNNN